MRRGSRVSDAHHHLGLALAAGAFLMVVTGLALLHPEWFGRGALAPRAVAADPGDPARLLRASTSLLEESRDGGATWRELPLLLAPDRPLALAFAPVGGEVWCLGESELLVSRDGGAVWAPVDLPAGIGPAEPPVGLAVPVAGRPVVTTEFGAWSGEREPGSWRPLWRFTPTAGDRLRAWARRLHAGRWGPPAVV
ncbi:MAG: hypothetical protein IH621_15195, partial [Krumholzibacteria bacterium]|nr:hypothetical protein [Candidatus Krumholzibacteria bacterium]